MNDPAIVSLVICTFNPAPALLQRCLQAVDALLSPQGSNVEITIVDNASEPPLSSREDLKTFLGKPRRRLVVEPRAGLTFARLAGVAASSGQILVFFDDDNLPGPEYLIRVQELIEAHNNVGVWGPGIVDVEWEAGTSHWIRGYATCFQERHAPATRFAAIAGWPDCYPTGTGMAARREVMEQYARQLEAGRLSAVGRRAGQMTSGEDAQIVWTAVRMGLSAGISPALRLTHFVERRKATLRYILRMVFATMASGRVAMRESFPDRPDLWTPPTPLAAQSRIVALALKQLLLLRLRSGPVQVVRELGDVHGQFLAARRRPPWLTRVAARAAGFAWVP